MRIITNDLQTTQQPLSDVLVPPCLCTLQGQNVLLFEKQTRARTSQPAMHGNPHTLTDKSGCSTSHHACTQAYACIQLTACHASSGMPHPVVRMYMLYFI